MYDLIIIGGGPAGLTAALYAGRARLKTLLLEKTVLGGQLLLTMSIENFPGFPGGIASDKFIFLMHKQVEELGVEIKTDEAVKMVCGNGFKVFGQEGEYQGRAVIIASGAYPKKINIPGEDAFLSRGVSYCATCDAPLFKGKDVFVIGGGDKAVEEAIFLTKYAGKVVLVHRRDCLRASKILQERILRNEKIEILWNTVPLEIKGEGAVKTITVKNNASAEIKDIPCDGVFIFVGIQPNTDYLNGLVKLDENGFVITSEEMASSCEGIFAAGDCRRKVLTQVITACADGATAAFCADRYLQTR